MAIKPIDQKPQTEENVRMKQLKADIREIISKRVRYCEIVDPPYSQNTMRGHMEKAIRIVIAETARETGKTGYIRAKDVFTVGSRKVDGTVRWLVSFDPQKWDEAWARTEASGDA